MKTATDEPLHILSNNKYILHMQDKIDVPKVLSDIRRNILVNEYWQIDMSDAKNKKE